MTRNDAPKGADGRSAANREAESTANPSSWGRPLDRAVDLIRGAEQHALVRGDGDAAQRLERLARVLEAEAAYEHEVDAGRIEIVRRADLPPGATVGFLLRQCAHTRQLRRAYGIPVDYELHTSVQLTEPGRVAA